MIFPHTIAFAPRTNCAIVAATISCKPDLVDSFSDTASFKPGAE
jgi:hypothetical protein